jgi:hypothetical protein
MNIYNNIKVYLLYYSNSRLRNKWKYNKIYIIYLYIETLNILIITYNNYDFVNIYLVFK